MSYRPRIIPSLLLSGKGLVKTIRFENPVYIGDPINTVKIFNDFLADELILLDIDATPKKSEIQYSLIKQIAEEAYMPLSYGGGICTMEQAQKLIQSGVEKLILGNSAAQNPELISELSNRYGSQAVVACIDVKKNNQIYSVYSEGGKKLITSDLNAYIEKVIKHGVGEIMIQFIDKDGTLEGLDKELVQKISFLVDVPVIVAGGTKSMTDIKEATITNGASAVAVGSFFSFLGSRNSVMINYPDRDEINEVFAC